MRFVRTDCAYYVGDRPCLPHKQYQARCDGCEHFLPAPKRLLIIKLDAIGDVLRTTCILEPLVHCWSDPENSGGGSVAPRITWVTRPESLPLLERNPYVTRAVAYGTEATTLVQSEDFDLIACLDSSLDAVRMAALAERASSRENGKPQLAGFVLRQNVVVPADERSISWWQMGLWDDLKQANSRTYQDHLMEMLGLSDGAGSYVLELSEEELDLGKRLLTEAGLPEGRRFIAVNVGGAGRWKYKRWTEPHMLEFARMVRESLGLLVAFVGGEDERPLIEDLLRDAPEGCFFPGVHPLRHFAAILAQAEVVVTGDTLAMHLSLAMRRETVILFGPTSLPEIETYGIGEKIAPDMDCLCCYLPICDRKPYCQELIEPATVMRAVTQAVTRARHGRRQP